MALCLPQYVSEIFKHSWSLGAISQWGGTNQELGSSTSLEIRGAKEQIYACWKLKCSWFSVKLVHKEIAQEQISSNFH